MNAMAMPLPVNGGITAKASPRHTVPPSLIGRANENPATAQAEPERIGAAETRSASEWRPLARKMDWQRLTAPELQPWAEGEQTAHVDPAVLHG